MRVVFSAYDWAENISGPATWLGGLLPELCRRGVDCHVDMLLWDEPGPLTANLREQGVSVGCTRMLPFTEDNVESMLGRLSRQEFDVFVPNNCVAALYAAAAVRAAGVPTVGVLHSDDAFYHGMLEVFVKAGGAFALTAVVAVSARLMEDARASCGPRTRAAQIHYGVRIPPSDETQRDLNQHLTVMYAGRFSQLQKRIIDVAAAIREIVEKIDGTVGILVGDGPESGAVRLLLEPLIADGRVVLTGRLSPALTQRQMATADALLLLSDFEGLPICLLEGMARGVIPIVTGMRSGVGELVVDGVNGFVVSDRTISVLEAVRTLKGNKALRASLSEAAVETIRQRFAEDMCVAGWQELLHTLAPSPVEGTMCFSSVLPLPGVHEALACEDHRRGAPEGISEKGDSGIGQRLKSIGRRLKSVLKST